MKQARIAIAIIILCLLPESCSCAMHDGFLMNRLRPSLEDISKIQGVIHDSLSTENILVNNWVDQLGIFEGRGGYFLEFKPAAFRENVYGSDECGAFMSKIDLLLEGLLSESVEISVIDE